MKTDRKYLYCFRFYIFLTEVGAGQPGAEMGSGINGNTKMGKYNRKIDGNRR